MDFSPNGQLVGAGDLTGRLRVWDLRGNARRSIHITRDTVYHLLFSGDGAKLITAGQSGVVRQWGVEDTTFDAILHQHSGPVRALSLSGDSRWLVSGAEDGGFRYIDLVTLTSYHYRGNSSRVRAIAQSSREGWIAAGADDGSIRLVQPISGNSRVLYGHTGTVAGLAFSPDGLRLASAGRDGTVRIWPLSEAPQDTIVPGISGAEFRDWLDGVTTASIKQLLQHTAMVLDR